MDHSSHITRHTFRDKRSDDALEAILEPWGAWRGKRVHLLSHKNKSPIVAVNSPESSYTDSIDLIRLVRIKENIINSGFNGTKKELRHQAYVIWKEWKTRIKEMNVPSETFFTSGHLKLYNSHTFCSDIDKILSQMHEPYYNILIYRYEHGWEMKDFCKEWGETYESMSVKLTRARKAARKELKKNGFRA